MIEPGEYCAIVSIEFKATRGPQQKAYQMFTVTVEKTQPRSVVANWVINEAVRRMRENAVNDGTSHLYGESFIPLFVSIKPE